MYHLITIGNFMSIAEWVTPAVALAVAGWFFRELQITKKEMSEIKVNYLDRFADLKGEVNKGNGEIKQAIADLREHLAERYMSKEDCNKAHQ